MSGNGILPSGTEDTRPANGAHNGRMPRWYTRDATHASFAVAQVGSHSDIYVPLATTSLAGAQAAADYASLQLLASPPRARVFRSTDQSIATGAFTAISFDTSQENDGGGAGGALPWNGTNPTRLTAPNGGLYAIGGAALWAATTGGTRRGASLRLNGATFINLPQVGNPAGAFAPSLVPVTIYRLAVADYIELVVIQDSGGPVLVSTAANYSPVLWFHRICA